MILTLLSANSGFGYKGAGGTVSFDPLTGMKIKMNEH